MEQYKHQVFANNVLDFRKSISSKTKAIFKKYFPQEQQGHDRATRDLVDLGFYLPWLHCKSIPNL